MPPVDPHRRAEVENWLDHHGVAWEYDPAVPLERIDFERSLQNQARVYTKLDLDRVATYAEAMERGDEFPAVVVNRSSVKAKLVDVDGNHRVAAYSKAEFTHIPAYVITKARPQTIVMLTFEANVKHGLPTSHEERLHQAVWLINNGASVDQAAAAVNVKSADIKKAMSRVKADQRADDVGILRTQWDGISQSSKNRLSNITTDEGFKDAASLTFRANLAADEVFELVSQCNQVRSSSRQQAIVKNFASTLGDRIQEAGAGVATGGRRQRTPKQAFNMVLGQLGTLPESPSAIAARFVGEERNEAAKRARDAAHQLTAIADELEASPA